MFINLKKKTMKKLLILTVLTVFLLFMAQVSRAGCSIYATPYIGSIQCDVIEGEYASDTYTTNFSSGLYLSVWATVSYDGPNEANNVTFSAYWATSSPTGLWPSNTPGQWTVIIGYTQSWAHLISMGDQAGYSVNDPYRQSGDVTVSALSTFDDTPWMSNDVSRGGIQAAW